MHLLVMKCAVRYINVFFVVVQSRLHANCYHSCSTISQWRQSEFILGANVGGERSAGTPRGGIWGLRTLRHPHSGVRDYTLENFLKVYIQFCTFGCFFGVVCLFWGTGRHEKYS